MISEYFVFMLDLFKPFPFLSSLKSIVLSSFFRFSLFVKIISYICKQNSLQGFIQIMKKIVFTEEFCQPENLFPFTLTRQIQDIRVGIFTIREKWEKALELTSFDKYEEDYKDLDRAIQLDQSIGDDIIYLVHGNVLPTPRLLKQVKKLKPGEFISLEGKESVVYCISKDQVEEPHRIKVQKSINLKE